MLQRYHRWFLTRLVQNLTLRNDCYLIPSVHETQQLSSLNDHWTWLMIHSFCQEWWVHGRIRTADCLHEKREPLPLDLRQSIYVASIEFNASNHLFSYFLNLFYFSPFKVITESKQFCTMNLNRY